MHLSLRQRRFLHRIIRIVCGRRLPQTWNTVLCLLSVHMYLTVPVIFAAGIIECELKGLFRPFKELQERGILLGEIDDDVFDVVYEHDINPNSNSASMRFATKDPSVNSDKLGSPFDIMNAVVCAKSKYAVDKCREAVRDHENEISVDVRKERKHKVVVLGSSGVGKTSLIYRQKNKDSVIPSINATIGASFVTCDMEVHGEKLQLQVWDTAGQERFRCMVPMYMRNASAAIIVFDITNRGSYVDVDKWAIELTRLCGVTDPLLVLVGNKNDNDKKRQVAYGEGMNKAIRLGARYYEVNIFAPEAIDQMFDDLANDLHGSSSAMSEQLGADTVILRDDDRCEDSTPVKRKKKVFGCCSVN